VHGEWVYDKFQNEGYLVKSQVSNYGSALLQGVSMHLSMRPNDKQWLIELSAFTYFLHL